MEFGIFDHLDRSPSSLADYYEERLAIVELFDRAGFHAYHLAEHHATPLGMAPSPSVFLAAVAAFAGILAAAGPGDGTHGFAIEQGYEMGRPSLLHLALTLRAGALQGAVVGGDAVIVSDGMIEA